MRVSEPGTYDYVCSIHPEMRATLVVEGEGESGGSGSDGGGGSGGGSGNGGGGGDDDSDETGGTSADGTGTSPVPSSSASLPTTGLELIWPLACAALLMAAGFLLLALDRALAPSAPRRTRA